MAARLAILALLTIGVAVAVAVYRSRVAGDRQLGAHDPAGDGWPAVPSELLPTGAAARTWLIFTTPMCASCPRVQAELEATFPSDAVVKVDATEQPHLAHRYAVRRAPTTVVANADGSVLDRFVGADAVRMFIAAGVD
ncbi:MAG: thioredoxin family protein [Actinobacteria bacterium]|nr:thioredoxin family protein [Actinomycetota bacterium]